MEYDFYWISASPNAWRAMLALEYKGVSYNSHKLDAGKQEHKSSAFLALNPQGKVPVLKCLKVLTHGAGAQGRIAPVDLFISRYAALPTRIRFDDAGVHGKAFALDQTCVHAATQHFIKQPAKQISRGVSADLRAAYYFLPALCLPR